MRGYDGFVDLMLISSFNKLKAMTTDIHLIRNVVNESTKVELDIHGMKIREIAPGSKKMVIDLHGVMVPHLEALEPIRNYILEKLKDKAGNPEIYAYPNFVSIKFSNESMALSAFQCLVKEKAFAVSFDTNWTIQENSNESLFVHYHSFPYFIPPPFFFSQQMMPPPFVQFYPSPPQESMEKKQQLEKTYSLTDIVDEFKKIPNTEKPPTFDTSGLTSKRVRAKKRQTKLAIFKNTPTTTTSNKQGGDTSVNDNPQADFFVTLSSQDTL
eukprot:CAMPEP_0117421750 /NCGR_PEP_ID=MMETSP0758-20121206/2744_1 /TAXON_ID=63605 /ORGANISM="Percolomonas cosmopolitus, Strain AE-1 (ATCC 50343)" /LENGTH=268 /DNA_ID=CAMNT_0005203991 /DNA_START=83 /DNA_END=889 /DNA_ORIENTATION=-